MKLLLSTLDMILLVDLGFVFQPKDKIIIPCYKHPYGILTVFESSKIFFALIVLFSLEG